MHIIMHAPESFLANGKFSVIIMSSKHPSSELDGLIELTLHLPCDLYGLYVQRCGCLQTMPS